MECDGTLVDHILSTITWKKKRSSQKSLLYTNNNIQITILDDCGLSKKKTKGISSNKDYIQKNGSRG